MSRQKLILASGSAIRAKILRNAGVDFDIIKTDTDEATIKKEGIKAGKAFFQIALDLATAKAQTAANTHPDLDDHYILGVDQIMEFEGQSYDKPVSKEEAFERLYAMRGKQHSLINAAVLVRNKKIIWQNIEQPKLWLREFSKIELQNYFAACDDSILKSVGGYQVESLGIRLFDRIDGDYFAVLGLAINPLLDALRQNALIDF